MSPRLARYPADFGNDLGTPLAAGYFGQFSREEVSAALQSAGATVVRTKLQPDHVLFFLAVPSAVQKIAALPFISFLGPQPMKSQAVNYNNRAAHGLDALSAPSGRNLQGDAVFVGIGDNSDPYTHVDFTGRLIDRYPAVIAAHGTHTSGTVGGAGILDPRYAGMAPHVNIISQYFTDILTNTPTYIQDYDMVLTNNSYTNYDPGCANDGEYDFLAYYTDAQLSTYPTLLHDFAAGNDGGFTCSPLPHQFGTIKSGFQCSKNVLTVGNLDNSNYTINPTSSCGPVNDGRLKPEIVAGGTLITSTTPGNTYGVMSGTSMATPTVTGTMALLVQRYRQLFGGDPPSALLKALACNTATDLGNPGPDYTFGFGSLNARAAIEALEGGRYALGALANGATRTYTLNVPSGQQQVRIMLYWPDYPAAPFSAAALVNDLDLTVTSPDATIHLPLVLNPNPAHVNDPAVEGADHLNNIEQVVINNPPAGSYSIKLKGNNVPMGPQNYVLTFQVIQPSVTVEYPFGNETWVPGQAENIRWSAYGGDPNTFTIEYSADNGASWTTISNSVPSTSRIYAWTAPAVATNQGRIRVTRNVAGLFDVSDFPFTVLGQPVVSGSNPCQGYAQLSWAAVTSATSYDVMELQGSAMQKIANTTSTSFLLGNLNRDSTYWLAVRAVNGATPGRRSVAVNITPSGGSCALSALDNDLTVDSSVAPLTGRLFTSTQLGSSTPIQVEIKNLGTVPTSTAYTLSYRVNGGSIVTESSSAAIAPNGVTNYTFLQTCDLSAVGTYTLQVWVTNPGDPAHSNDTLTSVIKQLANAPLVLNPSFMEGFESAAAATYTNKASGFTGLDRCDLSASDPNGRARTFINSGFSRTGQRAATLDRTHYNTTSTSDSLTMTFNLSSYSSADQLWLDFFYQNQGIDFSMPGNQVWIRGNDQAAWIPVYTLSSSSANFGVYQPSAHIDITGTLKGASQTISSSFQIRFGEQGFTSTNSVVVDGDLDDGYTFDDITLSRSSNDIGLIGLVGPNLSNSCALSNAETIQVKVKSYSAAPATNIPVSYSVNGVTVTESIPSLNPFDSIVYTFTHTADLSSFRKDTIRAWVSMPGDNYAFNDSMTPVIFHPLPIYSSFPYLEGFEASDGNWYTDGINDSWQWGSPAKSIIRQAAGGQKCWVTSLTGNYNDNELSYLYSPCFDLSSLANPVLSFSHIFQTEDACDCDYHWVEYTTDGITWTKLGAVGSGTNWYDNTIRQAWQKSDTIWHVSSYDIPTRASRVRFRFVFNSDPATNYEGVAIDDIHIFDKAPVYSGVNIGGGFSQAVNGSAWIPFDLGGRRIAAINPNGQDLGNTLVKVYMNTGAVRNNGTQYYLDRNIVIQPSNAPAGNVSVRFYFLDSEINALRQATGCAGCTTLHDAYQSGITQYSSPIQSEEDSTFANDSSGFYHFFQPRQQVSVVPYDNGYYAEYQVKGFSEFWLDGGGAGFNQSLPLTLLSFTATRSGNGALLQWTTTHETGVLRYVIQKSPDGAVFNPTDSVNATNDSNAVNTYRYTDKRLWQGVNYYRLLIEDQDGQFSYSPVRTVTDSSAAWVITVYPNPVHSGDLYISSSVNCTHIGLVDAVGKSVIQHDTHGFLLTIPVTNLARGVYFLVVDTDAGRSVQKVFVK
jgi:hypothetical protein